MVMTYRIIFDATKWNRGKRDFGEKVQRAMDNAVNHVRRKIEANARQRITTTGEATGMATYVPNPENYNQSILVNNSKREGEKNYNYTAELAVTHPWAEGIEGGTSPHEISPSEGNFLVFWTREGRLVITRFPVQHPGGEAKFIVRDAVGEFEKEAGDAIERIEVEM